MRFGSFSVHIRTPIQLRRVKPWFCSRCCRYSQLTRNGRCTRCHGPLRKVGT